MGNKFVRGGGDSKFTKPTGLYPTCEWDDKAQILLKSVLYSCLLVNDTSVLTFETFRYKAVKKLIIKKKVAPRYPGREEPGPELDECPICFLVSHLNPKP
jgi:hypothetical protein